MSLSSLLIADAFAQNSTKSNTEAGFMNFVPLILIFLIFYFLLIRPQQKKMKQHQNLINNIKVGDKIVTTSGIFGTVKSIDAKTDQIELKIADDVVIRLLKNNISDLEKSEEKPVEKQAKNKKDKHSKK